MNRKALLFVILAILVAGGVVAFGRLNGTPDQVAPASAPRDTISPDNSETMTDALSRPELTIDQSKSYTATLKTSEGDIEIALFADKAPIAVNNFVHLSNAGFYDGVIFHRVIEGFMIQGGDPEGTGRGGPGYTFEDEFDDSLKHDKAGVLSMANAGPNTNGSQFFITLAPTPHLNGVHTIFGEVVGGMEVVQAIGASATDRADKPLENITINSIVITEE